MNKYFLILAWITSSVFGQQHISLNLGGAAGLNFNTPLQTLEVPYKSHTNYISPNVIANLSIDINRSFFSLEPSYHFRNYGFIIEILDEDYYYRFIQKQITETFSLQLIYNHHLYYFSKMKSHLHFSVGGAYSFIQHVATLRHYSRKVGGYYIVTWEGAFEREELQSTSPTACLGFNIKSIIRNIGPINYGLRYHFDFEPMPNISSEIEYNGRFSKINFQTQQHYIMAFLTVSLFSFEKQHDRWKWRRY